MSTEIVVAIIAGAFLVLNTTVSAITALLTKRTSESVKHQGTELAKRFDETAKVVFIEGERASFDALTRLTLQEEIRVRVTRFSPRQIQRQMRYYEAMVARVLGRSFEDENHGRLEKYYRLTSLNSEENKRSLVETIEYFLERGCNNLVLRITADKNDFELLVFDQLKVAAVCFHDLSKHTVVHSSLITRDENLFNNLEKLYQRLWDEDILLEVDFSLGPKVVRTKLEQLRRMPPIQKTAKLSPIESVIHESRLKIEACKAVVERRSEESYDGTRLL